MTLIRTFAVTLSLASSALARTDLAGCTYTDLVVKPTQMAAYASRLWYVPDTGEVCEFLDCGGGRAPPKSTVPGCPLYTGTETYAPSYINPKTLGNGVVEAGSSVAAATTPVLATASESATASATASETASATASESTSAAASASATASTTTEASITILTGTNTSTPSKSAESSSAQTTSAASTAGASSSSSASSKTAASGSNSGAATTTSPSSAAGAMQTVGAVLGPCVVAAIAAGLA